MKTNLTKKIVSAVLSFVMLLGCVPAFAFPGGAASAADIFSAAADPYTMNDYKSFFPVAENISTKNAGGVWTDKSVFTTEMFEALPAGSFPAGIGKQADSFLVALSAIGSNLSVTGQSSSSTDTVFVLDVSGSMSGQGDELAAAVNASMAALLTNANNRVGIVLYENDITTLLPLDYYTTASDGNYINSNYSGTNLSVDRDVRNKAGGSVPSNTTDISGGTYIQGGLGRAMDLLMGTSVGENEKRKPIVVLLTDGEATRATNNFTNPGSYKSSVGDGSNGSAVTAFLTQLTAAYMKREVKKHYNNNECLIYTLGLGISSTSQNNDAIRANNILDPTITANAVSASNPNSATYDIKEFWDTYNGMAAGGRMRVYNALGISNDLYVTKSGDSLDIDYANQSYTSAQGSDLANAFEQIITEIELQSAYHPTLVYESADTSGYISFIDRIGEHMTVTDVKGIVLGDQHFSGAEFASNLVNGGFGSVSSPSELGNQFAFSVRDRLGVSIEEARTLIGLAYQNGQFAYTDENNFSNYIGWYADENDKYLGYWCDGVTTAPSGAKYVVKSYGYLGVVNGLSKSDMMYITVRVRRNIETGEEVVAFAVPAALLPLISYSVALNVSNEPVKVSATPASPIRLVYEVALDPGINRFNVAEKTGSTYFNANKSGDIVSFYANAYDPRDPANGAENCYSYFRPSKENDRYYYQEDSVVYSDSACTQPFKGNALDPGTVYYHKHEYYVNNNGSPEKVNGEHPIAAETYEDAVNYPDKYNGAFYIPAGTLRRQYSQAINTTEKTANTTNTLPYAASPYATVQSGGDFIVGAYLGNNGLINLKAETGVKITKTFAEGTAASDKYFEFTVEASGADPGNTDALRISAAGVETEETVSFTGGKATVKVKAGESLYIGGLSAGTAVKITETDDLDYVLRSINGIAGAAEAAITLAAGQMWSAEFVNADSGKGDLTVTKEVVVPAGIDIDTNKKFEITVSFGEAFAGKEIVTAIKGTEGTSNITLDSFGSYKFGLAHDQQIQFFDIPEGTVVNVAETAESLAGFTAKYFVNGTANGQSIEIIANRENAVVIENTYQPESYSPVNITVNVEKTYEPWMSGRTETFDFELQKYNAETGEWETLSSKNDVAGDETDGKVDFGFENVFGENEVYTSVGTYIYRIIEVDNGEFGVIYDKNMHSFAVNVADDGMSGKMKIESVTYNGIPVEPTAGKYNITAEFNNSYDSGKAEASVEVHKKIESSSGEMPAGGLSGFEFKLSVYKDGLLVNAPITLATTATGTVRFPVILAEGIYTAELVEIEGSINNMTYDKDVKHLVIVVATDTSAVPAKLVAKVYMKDASAEAIAAATDSLTLEVTNKYEPVSAELSLEIIKKTLNGRDLAAGEFEFEIIQRLPDGNGGYTDGSSYEGTNNAANNGSPALITFSDASANSYGVSLANNSLVFAKAGTYYYLITEKPGTLKDVTYDPNEYRMVVTVTDNGGVLSAVCTVLNTVDNTITFVNSYVENIIPVPYSVNGTKVLTGGLTLVNDQFGFVMVEAEANGSVKTGGNTYLAKNTKGDKNNIAFPEIVYTEAGTHYYLVSEVEESIGQNYGIKYDKTVYLVTVVITKPEGSDQLAAEASYQKVGAGNILTPASELKFTNEYVSADAEVILTATKEYLGGTLEDDMFFFEISNDSGYKKEFGNIGSTVTFEKLTFVEEGIYTYTVKEVNGELANVIYDEKVYTVIITVTDNLRGALTADVKYTAQDGAAEVKMHFINSYDAPATDASLVISGEKILNGRAPIDGEFKFELYKALDSGFSIAGIKPLTANNNSGRYSFTLNYTEPEIGNTYYYLVKETDLGAGGIVYSDRVYKLRITVGYDEVNNKVTATGEVIGETVGITELDFVNTYTATASSAVIEGSKIFEGGSLYGNDFEFELYKSNSSGSQGEYVMSVFNDRIGHFEFPEMQFDKAGVYYYLVKEAQGGTSANGISYDGTKYIAAVTVTDNGEGKLSASVSYKKTSGASADEIVFTNRYSVSGSDGFAIAGNKILVGRDLIDGEFTFELYRTDSSYDITGLEPRRTVTNKNGRYFFNMIYDVSDYGKIFYYAVREKGAGTSDANGITYSDVIYTVRVRIDDNGQGELCAFETVTSHEGLKANQLDFTNIYTPREVSASFGGNKVLTGKDLTAGMFSFELYRSNQTWSAGELIETVKNGAFGEFAFASMTFDKAGTYRFIVRETNGGETIEGISYDASIYRVTVKVTDNGNGTLSASVIYEDVNGNAKPAIVFTNSYAVSGEASIGISGNKTLGGRDLIDGEFVFELYEDGKLIASAANKGGKYSFTLTYGAADVGKTFTYTVSEKNAGKTINGVTYDSTVYTVTVKAEDDGKGGIKLTSNAGGTALDSLDFANTYKAESASAVIEGEKILTGKELSSDMFRFELYKSDSAWSLGEKTDSASNNAQGGFAFGGLTFTEAGSYFYLVKELSGGKTVDGIKYDARTFRVLIEVTDDLNGSLIASIKVFEENGSAVSGIVFVNTYEVNGEAVISLSGTKTLIGRDLIDGEFAFELLDGTKVIASAVNIGGKYTVSIAYGPADAGKTFTYTLREKNSGKSLMGITYSDVIYTVTVKVSDDGKGNLTASASAGGLDISKLDFVNEYKTSSAKVELEGTKNLIGLGLGEGMFSFELCGSDSDWSIGEIVANAQNDANGRFTFSTLTFDKAGTYCFIVRETNGGKTVDGISYDASIYRIRVTVVDDLKGKLEAFVLITDTAGHAASGVQFTNVYAVTENAGLIIGGNKAFEGRELIAGEFAFELKEKGTELVYIAKNGENGTFTFPEIIFTKAGIYSFEITESSANALPGVSYDNSAYTLTVTVADNGKGALEIVSEELTKNGAAVSAIEFVNTYKAESTSVILGGSKILSGRGLIAGEFTFILTDENGNVLEAVNGADGAFAFPALSFDAPGAYIFTVSELAIEGMERVTFDNSVYTVIIKVTDDIASGKLSAEYSIKTESGDASGLVFENVYTPEPGKTEIEIGVSKQVENIGMEKIGPEGFSFILKNAATSEMFTVITDENGKAVFKLAFGENDIGKIYTYTLSELNEGREHVAYSTEQYEITAIISLGEDNVIDVALKLNGADTEKIEAGFVNIYDYTKTEDIEDPDVPGTDNPETGDSTIFRIMGILVGGAVLGTTVFKRRRELADE